MIAKLLDTRDLGPEVKHFTFEAPEVETLNYKSGQFVSMTREINGKKITRAYSVVSPPYGNRFELCLNKVEAGHFSPFLFALEPGDTVDFKGPIGAFVWRTPPVDSVLVATGTGVAPFRGMLMERLPQDGDHQITLIFGVRYEHSLLYHGEFERMAKEHANFQYMPTVTRPSELWNGRAGRVQPYMLEVIGERRDLDVYICGLKEMVDETRETLKTLGFEKKQIIFEKYD